MNDITVKGQLKRYLSWPLYLTVFWLLFVVMAFFINPVAGGVGAAFLVVQIVVVVIISVFARRRIAADLIDFAVGYGQIQKKLLQDFVLPYALLDADGHLLWMNEAFKDLIGRDIALSRHVTAVIPELTRERLPGREEKTECSIRLKNRDFCAAMEMVELGDFNADQKMLNMEGANYLIALYLFDETEVNSLLNEKEANRPVCGVISLDNYDEAIESVEAVRQSLLLALVERKINRCFSDAAGALRKLDNERYFFVIRKSAFEEMKAARFPLLDEVKSVNIGNTMAVTISIGIGLGGASYAADEESARGALEMALGRGGDQVVVRDGETTTYYGGKTVSIEKGNRVKARVKARALYEIIKSKDNILVMGHQLTDIDALGAGIGIFAACRAVDKEAHLVINDPQPSIAEIIGEFRSNPIYPDDMFLNSARALETVNANTALVVVDTNRPSYTECSELLNKVSTIVVIDHHRQSKEVVRGAQLSYVEPYASSACEMVAEILQYFGEVVKLKPIEADMMYGGIMIDTNNYKSRAGVRTFEAAAYLRRSGADITRVRKRFRESIEDYKTRARIIAAAEIFDKVYAISVCPSEGLTSPTIVSAEAANELLNIIGVKASFVLTKYNDMIYISARAIDEVNVQLIMERLGGGGHMNIAGAQLKDMTLEEARRLLRDTITEMTKEGEI